MTTRKKYSKSRRFLFLKQDSPGKLREILSTK